jgi:DNA-binding ferritin-like protein
VATAVQRDLDAIAERAPQLATGALAATALALARSIDSPGTSSTARSMCARALVDVIDHLNALVPEPIRSDDPIAQLLTRRQDRKRAPA